MVDVSKCPRRSSPAFLISSPYVLPIRFFFCCPYVGLAQATEDLVAFTIRHSSGVICASMEEKRLEV